MSSNQGSAAAIGWAALSIIGFAAALSLIVAGQSVGYQHYLPLSQLLFRPVSIAIIAVQALLVMIALRRQWRELWARIVATLPSWRLAILAMAMIGSSAIVGRDLARYGGEMFLSTFVQAINLATVVLAVRAIPGNALNGLRVRFAQLLGSDVPFGEDIAPRVDRFVLVAALVVTGACALLAFIVYSHHPHIQDEVAYLYQARMFAHGQLALARPPVPDVFAMYLFTLSERGWHTPVPPGLAIALVPGVLLGAPWAVNPVLTGANIILAYLVLQPLFGRRVARLSVLLLAVSPWNLFIGMSFMPHAFTLFCALAATLGVIRARRTGHARWPWLGGLALGMLAYIRQLDAMVVAAALGLWCIGLGGRRLRISGTVGLVLGSMLATIPLLVYNRLFTGKAGSFPMMVYTDALFGKGTNDYGFGSNRGLGWALDPNPGHGPIDGMINAALNTAATQVELFGWSVGSLLLVYVFVLRGRLTQSDRLMLGVIALVWLAYFFNYFAGGPDFGARYWFLMIVPLAALTARGIFNLGAGEAPAQPAAGESTFSLRETRILAAVSLFALIAVLVFIPWRSVDKYWHYRGMRPDIQQLARDNAFGPSLVLISGREVPDYNSAAIYNPLNWRAPAPVFAHRITASTDTAVIAAYAGRPVWFVDGPTVSGKGYVVRAGPLSTASAMAFIGVSPFPAGSRPDTARTP